jgi:hypothetical protein
MVVEGMQALPALVNHISLGHGMWEGLNHLFSLDWSALAQLQTDTNIGGNFGNAWNNFVKTGQIWALLIGIAIGYFLKSFTSF